MICLTYARSDATTFQPSPNPSLARTGFATTNGQRLRGLLITKSRVLKHQACQTFLLRIRRGRLWWGRKTTFNWWLAGERAYTSPPFCATTANTMTTDHDDWFLQHATLTDLIEVVIFKQLRRKDKRWPSVGHWGEDA